MFKNLNVFYVLDSEVNDADGYALEDFGHKVNKKRIVNLGNGHLDFDTYFVQAQLIDYDKRFVELILKTSPYHKVNNLLDFHLINYKGDKIHFILQVKHSILPILENRKKYTYAGLVKDWIAIKEPKQNTMSQNTYHIKTGDINAPTLLQQHAINSNQTQQIEYVPQLIEDLFKLIESDITALAPEQQEDFIAEIEYARRQLKKEKDVSSQLFNLGSLITNIGLPFFVNLTSSGIFEAIKPALGL